MTEEQQPVQAVPPCEVDVSIECSSTGHTHEDSPISVVAECTVVGGATMRDMVPIADEGGAEEVITCPVDTSDHGGEEETLSCGDDLSSFGCLDSPSVVINRKEAACSNSSASISDHHLNSNNNDQQEDSPPTNGTSESAGLNTQLGDGFTGGISSSSTAPDTVSSSSSSSFAAASTNSQVPAEGSAASVPEEDLSQDGAPLTTAEGGDAPRTSEDGAPINPFVHRIHFRYPYDYIKIAVLSVLLLPLRIIGITVSLVLAYIFSSLGLYGINREDLSKRPITGWRGYMRLGMGFSGRLMTRCYGFHVISIKGKLAPQKEAPIVVVGPHSSFFDGLAVYWSKVPGLVSRSENLHIPLFGKYIDYTQPVYVWRESTNSRQQTIQEIKHRATSKDNWPQVMVFPEGTCTNRSCLITFKPGAFYPGVPVQPIVVRYMNQMDTTTWTWDGPGALKLLFLTLCQFHNFCEIEYLPVYTPSEEEKKDAHLFAANVRAVMAKALGVPVVDYTYDDCRLMHKAKVNKLPPQTGLIEFQKLRQQLGLNLKEVEQCLETQFCRLAQRDGKARLPDLARYVGLPASEPEVVRLFNTFDRNSRGEVNFREYLLGYCELVKPLVTEHNLQSTFVLFNADAAGDVTRENFTKAMASSFELTQEEAAAIFKEIDTQNRGSFSLDEWSSACSRKGELLWVVRAYQQSVAAASRHHTRPLQAAPGKDKAE